MTVLARREVWSFSTSCKEAGDVGAIFDGLSEANSRPPTTLPSELRLPTLPRLGGVIFDGVSELRLPTIFEMHTAIATKFFSSRRCSRPFNLLSICVWSLVWCLLILLPPYLDATQRWKTKTESHAVHLSIDQKWTNEESNFESVILFL